MASNANVDRKENLRSIKNRSEKSLKYLYIVPVPESRTNSLRVATSKYEPLIGGKRKSSTPLAKSVTHFCPKVT